MPNSVLVIDNDPSLATVLQRPLSLKGYSVHVTEGGEEALKRIAQTEPSLMFLAVELPDRKGFELFSKAKRMTPRVPVVMVTSTLPKSDLQMHEKLRIHADYYFDKRTLNVEALASALNNLLGLDLAPEDLSTIAATRNGPSSAEQSDGSLADSHDFEGDENRSQSTGEIGQQDESFIEELYPDGLDPDVISTFDDETLDDDDLIEGEFAGNGMSTLDTTEDIDQLREEIADLRSELADARRDAQSSPFSSNFSKLRDSTRIKDKKIRLFKRKVVSLTRDASTFAKERDELAANLKQTTLEKDHAVSHVSDLEKRWSSTESKLSALRREYEDAKVLHAKEREHISRELATKIGELQASSERYHGDLNDLRASNSQELEKREKEHASQLTALEKKLGDKKEEAVSSLKKIFAQRLEDKHRQYDQSADDLKEKNQSEIKKLKRSHDESISEAKREIEELHKKAADQEEVLKRQNSSFQELIKETEEQHRAQLNEAEQRHRSDLAAERKQWKSSLEGLEKEEHSLRQGLEGRLDNSEQEARAKLAALEQEKREVRERFDKRLSDAENQMRSKLAAVEQEKQEIRKQLENRLASVENDWRSQHQKLEQEKRQAEEHLENKLETTRVESRAEQTRLEEEKQDLLRKHEEKSKEVEDDWHNQFSRLETEKQVIEQSLENKLKEVAEKGRLDLEQAEKRHVSEREALENKYEAEIQKLRDDTERSSYSTEELHQQYVNESQEAVRELARLESRLEETRKDHEAKMSELQARHEFVLKQTETESRSMIAALESKARDAKGQATKELETQFWQKLEKERQEHSEALSALHKKFDEEIKLYQSTRQGSTSPPPDEAIAQATGEIKNLRDKIAKLDVEMKKKDKIVTELIRSVDAQKQSLAEKDEMIGSLKAVIEDSYR